LRPPQLRLSADTQVGPTLVPLGNTDKMDKTLVAVHGRSTDSIRRSILAGRLPAGLIQTRLADRTLNVVGPAWGERAFWRHSSTCFLQGRLAASALGVRV
jgi:hypothetical protein